VVAAAVVLRNERLPARIDDSKRLTSAQRARAFHVILEHAGVGFGIVCAEEIDRRNILHATLLAMQHAILDLPQPARLILVDGTVSPPVSTPCWPIVHGDQRSYVISCASIMAKVLRDRLMEFYHTLFPRYGFNRHKGYGTALHATRLHALGPSPLHRRSFRPVAEAIAALTRFQTSNETIVVAPVPPSQAVAEEASLAV